MKNLFLIPIALAILSCSGIRVVNSEANQGFNLSNYKTFDFYELEQVVIPPQTFQPIPNS